MALKWSPEPFHRKVERLAGISPFGSARRAFIEGHHYIRTYFPLDVDDLLGSKQMFRAVDVAPEPGSFLGELAAVGKREHLKAPGIRKNRAVPPLETVEASGLA